MAGKPRMKKSKTVTSHPYRIVPMFPPPLRMTEVTGPLLTYRGGPLLTAVEVFALFWGAGWQQAPQSALVSKINTFFDFVLTSSLLDQLGEYSVNGQSIIHGKRTGSATLTTPNPPVSLPDASIRQLIQNEISTGTLPTATPNSLYFVFLPPGVQAEQGSSASCQSFCGYHDVINQTIFYAVMPYPGCTGCTGGLNLFDALTSTISHELCEAITDPIPGQGWYDDANGEIGDICAWQTKKIGDFIVQKEWSNKARACI